MNNSYIGMQKTLIVSLLLNIVLIAFIMHPKQKLPSSDIEAKVRLEQIQKLLKENDSLKSLDHRLQSQLDSIKSIEPKVIIIKKHEAIDNLPSDSVSVKYDALLDSLRAEYK